MKCVQNLLLTYSFVVSVCNTVGFAIMMFVSHQVTHSKNRSCHLLHLDEDHIFDSFRFLSLHSFFFCYFPSLFLIDKWIKKYDSSSHTYKKRMIRNVDKNVGILCFSTNQLNLRTHQILNAVCENR